MIDNYAVAIGCQAACFGEGSGSVLYRDIDCPTTALSFSDCSNISVGTGSCSNHSRDAGVICGKYGTSYHRVDYKKELII